MTLFEYVNQRVGPFAIQEGFGGVGASRFFQVDSDEVPVDDLASISMVVTGRMRITNQDTGARQELAVGHGSYEISRKRGRLHYEAIEPGSRFVCVAPAGAGQQLRHRKTVLEFGRTATVERKHSLLLLGEGDLMIEKKFASGPAIIWLKRNVSTLFAHTRCTYIEFWLEQSNA